MPIKKVEEKYAGAFQAELANFTKIDSYIIELAVVTKRLTNMRQAAESWTAPDV